MSIFTYNNNRKPLPRKRLKKHMENKTSDKCFGHANGRVQVPKKILNLIFFDLIA